MAAILVSKHEIVSLNTVINLYLGHSIAVSGLSLLSFLRCAGNRPLKAALEALFMTLLRKEKMGVANGKARFMQVRNWLNPAKLCPAFVLCFFFLCVCVFCLISFFPQLLNNTTTV